MQLHIHNTLTRQKEIFTPIDANDVRMYVCGPTVYDFAHLGNARPVVVFDTLYRLLKRHYPHVTYARNITDVDDKIMAKAKDSGESIDVITERTTQAFHGDMAALNALPPDIEPRCTQHIPQMIAMTQQLIDKGNAYVAEGHVLFNVPSMPEYGQLSRRPRDELIAGGARRCRAVQKRPRRFRAVETEHGGASRLGQPVGPWASGLAYRMFGHGEAASWHNFRYSRRRA